MKEWVHDNSLALMFISLAVAGVWIAATASYDHRVKKREYLEQKQKVEHYRDSLMHAKRQ